VVVEHIAVVVLVVAHIVEVVAHIVVVVVEDLVDTKQTSHHQINRTNSKFFYFCFLLLVTCCGCP
jgi:hypothetical protein